MNLKTKEASTNEPMSENGLLQVLGLRIEWKEASVKNPCLKTEFRLFVLPPIRLEKQKFERLLTSLQAKLALSWPSCTLPSFLTYYVSLDYTTADKLIFFQNDLYFNIHCRLWPTLLATTVLLCPPRTPPLLLFQHTGLVAAWQEQTCTDILWVNFVLTS